MASTAVFFGNGDEYVDGEETEQQIRELAGLLSENDLRVRLVGYAGDGGSESANEVLARKRVEKVARRLTSLGIEPSRLRVVSRSTSMPISEGISGTNDRNRRVTFENVFRTETSQ